MTAPAATTFPTWWQAHRALVVDRLGADAWRYDADALFDRIVDVEHGPTCESTWRLRPEFEPDAAFWEAAEQHRMREPA
ncbi:hypothetical protein [Cellulomonas sp. PSBB021]|uniref:hypothetical protein n=1 Tax=Cellulomonas sp. PSBB021 TaxID=2003551 RepID=UPI000B8D4CA0|nr:hypothetical protein [Cellulomonas sp. PSBB021]ASR54195.1 hypothetical protein CBP52_02465 [Cellulomonas sp. PSBB021]